MLQKDDLPLLPRVVHELWHAFADNKEPYKGIFFAEGYEGPSLEEMTSLCSNAK